MMDLREGVIELIDGLIADDLKEIDDQLTHRHIALGTRLDQAAIRIPPYGYNILAGDGRGRTSASRHVPTIRRHIGQCVSLAFAK
jgi:hypothetical protein